MAEVSVGELCAQSGDVIKRVEAGEHLVVTRSGKPVAELRPLGQNPLPLAVVLRHRTGVPTVDPDPLKHQIDELIEPGT